MKNIILILLLICLASTKYNQNDETPRQSVSCPSNQIPGYTWDGQKCEVCRTGNCFCDSYNGCNRCDLYYGLLKNGGAQTCSPCNTNGGNIIQDCCFDYDHPLSVRASTCNNVTASSLTDKTAYIKFGSICYFIQNCLQYEDYGKCKVCQDGFYLSEWGTCQKCGVWIKKTTTATVGCYSCSGPNSCNRCDENYFIEMIGINEQISVCRACTAFCTCNSTVSCTGCTQNAKDTGYVYSGGSCSLCNLDADNCLTCIIDSTSNAKTCTLCKPKTAQSATTKKCIACPSNCLKCNLANGDIPTCLTDQCANGFYPNGGNCVACKQSAMPQSAYFRCNLDTSTSANQTVVVTQCQQVDNDIVPFTQSYYLWTNSQNVQTCVKNDNSCKKMKQKNADTNAGQCETCYEDLNWILTSKSAICKQCGATIQSCIACKVLDQSDDLQCTQCRLPEDIYYWSATPPISVGGYFLQGPTVCQQCISGCLTCSNANNCTSCLQGWLFKSDGTCEFCASVQNCQTCSSGSATCNACFPSFRLWKQNVTVGCEKCPNYCNKCSNNRDVCEECLPGYYLQRGVCQSPRSNCNIQNNDGCTSCAYGFRLVNGWCISCYNQNNGGSAYVSCNYGCSSKYYSRDGDRLTEKYESSLNQNNAGKNGAIIVNSLLILISALLFLL